MNKETQQLLRELLAAHPSVQGECTVTEEGFTDGDDGTTYKGTLAVDDGGYQRKHIPMGTHNNTVYRFIIAECIFGDNNEVLAYVHSTWGHLRHTQVELTQVHGTDSEYWSVTSNGVHWCDVWKVQQGDYGYSPGNPNPTQWYGEA